MSQQRVTSARSNLSALVPQASRPGGPQSLLDNRSTFLSSFFQQKTKKQASLSQTSKTSLRRIESYEEVLHRLKASVMLFLAGSKKKRGGSPDGNESILRDTYANPARAEFLAGKQKSGNNSLTRRGNRRIHFERSPTKQVYNANPGLTNVKRLEKGSDVGFFHSAGSSAQAPFSQSMMGTPTGFQTSSQQVPPKQL